MSSIVDAIYELKYNPFEFSQHIASFYSKVNCTENNLLYSPLVIPLCTHPLFRKKLFYSKSTSTLWSVFADRQELYDLQDRIDEFQSLTEQCIQYCLVNDWLFVDEKNLSLGVSTYSVTPFKPQKIAEKLGRLFGGHTVIEVYAFLGVKPR